MAVVLVEMAATRVGSPAAPSPSHRQFRQTRRKGREAPLLRWRSILSWPRTPADLCDRRSNENRYYSNQIQANVMACDLLCVCQLSNCSTK